MMKRLLLIFIFLLLLPIVGNAEDIYPKVRHSVSKSTDNTSIELFSDGQKEIIAKFAINEGWHIYWSNPGEIGKPTIIKSVSSENPIKVINQSVPQIEKTYEIMDEYIYKNTAYFSLELQNPEDVGISFTFVECEDYCKPEKLMFKLDELPQTSEKIWKNIKREAQDSFPKNIVSTVKKGTTAISVELPKHESITVIPAEREVVSGENMTVNENSKKTEISWQNVSEQKRLKHALIVTPDTAFDVELKYDYFDLLYFIRIVLLAFLGGLILNAMPCVFPILSLKVFGLMKKNSGKSNYKEAALYCLGVLSAFWGLALILVFLKNRGEAVGWGFQLQSPYFVGAMLVIFFVLFLFMTEVIKFPDLSGKKIYELSALNEFLTGFFAVLIASPCTGPFMGAAIGYAFMQSDAEVFAVFTALSLGYAFPFALAEVSPKFLHRILPKPGKWMVKIKQILAIPVLLTCMWLAGVLVSQIYLPIDLNKNGLNWQKFDAVQVKEAADAGENVFVDFTAQWCLTCMFNEKTILSSAKFKKFVKDNNVVLFKADMTEDNDDYDKALSSYGRDGIPLYVYYHNGSYQILSVFFNVDKIDISENK